MPYIGGKFIPFAEFAKQKSATSFDYSKSADSYNKSFGSSGSVYGNAKLNANIAKLQSDIKGAQGHIGSIPLNYKVPSYQSVLKAHHALGITPTPLPKSGPTEQTGKTWKQLQTEATPSKTTTPKTSSKTSNDWLDNHHLGWLHSVNSFMHGAQDAADNAITFGLSGKLNKSVDKLNPKSAYKPKDTNSYNVGKKIGSIMGDLVGGGGIEGATKAIGERLGVKGIAKALTRRGATSLAQHSPELTYNTSEKIAKRIADAFLFKSGSDTVQGYSDPNAKDAITGKQDLSNAFGQGAREGTGQLVTNAGQIADWLNHPQTSEALRKAGAQIAKGFSSKYDKGATWRDFLDPKFYANSLGQNLPNSIALMPFGIAGGIAGKAAGSAMKLGSFGKAVLTSIGGSALPTVMESAMEAGNTYDQAIQQKMTKAQAEKAATDTFHKNLALLGITNSIEIGSAFTNAEEHLLSKIANPKARLATKLAIPTVTEAGQEVLQNYIQNQSTGQKTKLLDPNNAQAALIGGAFGLGFGAAGHVFEKGHSNGANEQQTEQQASTEQALRNIHNNTYDNLPDNLKQEHDTLEQNYESRGMDNAQAAQQAMSDIIDQHPEVNKIVQQATEQETKKAAEEEHPQNQQEINPEAQAHQDAVNGYEQGKKEEPVKQPSEQPKVEEPKQEEPKPVSEKPVTKGHPFQIGDKVTVKGRQGHFEVVDNKDKSMLTLKNENGTSMTVGRAAISGIVEGGSQEAAKQEQPKQERPKTETPKTNDIQVGDKVTIKNQKGSFEVLENHDKNSVRVKSTNGKGSVIVDRRAITGVSGKLNQEAQTKQEANPNQPKTGNSFESLVTKGQIKTFLENNGYKPQGKDSMDTFASRVAHAVNLAHQHPAMHGNKWPFNPYYRDAVGHLIGLDVSKHPWDEKRGFTDEAGSRLEEALNRNHPNVAKNVEAALQLSKIEARQEKANEPKVEAPPKKEANYDALSDKDVQDIVAHMNRNVRGAENHTENDNSVKTVLRAINLFKQGEIDLLLKSPTFDAMLKNAGNNTYYSGPFKHFTGAELPWDAHKKNELPKLKEALQKAYDKYKKGEFKPEAKQENTKKEVKPFITDQPIEKFLKDNGYKGADAQWLRVIINGIHNNPEYYVNGLPYESPKMNKPLAHLTGLNLDNILDKNGQLIFKGLEKELKRIHPHLEENVKKALEGKKQEQPKEEAVTKKDIAEIKKTSDFKEFFSNANKIIEAYKSNIINKNEMNRYIDRITSDDVLPKSIQGNSGMASQARSYLEEVSSSKGADRKQIALDQIKYMIEHFDKLSQESPKETTEATPNKTETPKTFKEGDQVSFMSKGKELTGSIRSIDEEEKTAKVDIDQISSAGGVPIGRIEIVPLDKLSKLEGKTSEENIPEETNKSVIEKGKSTTFKTESGMEVKGFYALVSADKLITSHDTNMKVNPDFPQELQPRDRERAASKEQINRMANKLEPEFLGASPKASEGAPIVGPDMVVESGNGRTLALKTAFEDKSTSANNYHDWLIDHAKEFGLSAKTISETENPVLVRVRTSAVDREEFVRQANESSVAAMSASEQAISDAKKLNGNILSIFYPREDGTVLNKENRDFVSTFMNEIVGKNERGRYYTNDGALSQEGVRRITNAIFAKAYGNVSAIERLAESTDNNVKNITNAMLVAAPSMADIQDGAEHGDYYPVSINSDIADAMQKLSELRDEGKDVQQYLNQGNLFGDDLSNVAKQLLQIFDNPKFKRSTKKLTSLFLEYANLVKDAGHPGQLDMFGGKMAPTKDDLLQAALDRLENDTNETLQGSLFETEQSDRHETASSSEKTGPTEQNEENKSGATSANEKVNLISTEPDKVTPEEFKAYTEGMKRLIDKWTSMIQEDSIPKGAGAQREFRKVANEIIGRNAEEDEWRDTMEAAIQLEAERRRLKNPNMTLKERIEMGKELESLMKISARSMEQMERQQYSTPIPLAEIANFAADPNRSDIVKEGSAGTGSLIIPMSHVVREINAIELSPRRAAILHALGLNNVTITNDSTFNVNKKASLVIGNPPFKGQNKHGGSAEFNGKAPWRGGWGDLGNRFLSWDLRSLPDGGRLVYVVSPNVIDNAANSPFRQWLKDNHTVRAMVKFPSDIYDTRGTKFGAGLIVVDKGKVANQAEPITGEANTLDELINMLEPLSGDENYARAMVQDKVEPTNTSRTGSTNESSNLRGQRGTKSSETAKNGGRQTVGNADLGGDRTAGEVLDRGNAHESVSTNDGKPSVNDEKQNKVPGEVRTGTQEPERNDSETNAHDETVRPTFDNVPSFTGYAPKRSVTGVKHMGDVVEPLGMQFVSMPTDIYTNDAYLPHETVTKGGEWKLSDVQIESVMAAKYNWLHNDKRGMLIADDTGMGKTAQLLGIAADTYLSGRAKRVLVITVKDQVANDSFLNENKKFGFNLPMLHINPEYSQMNNGNFKDKTFEEEPEKWKPIDYGHGVLLMSQYTFRDSQEAVHRWLNDANGDVQILHDESHIFKNPESKLGIAGKDLFQAFKDKAQFIYASATASEDIEGLEHLYGLKLWNPDSFGTFQERLTGHDSQITSGGKRKTGLSKSLSKKSPFAREIPITMMEQITRELKMTGQYVGRQLSMEGITTEPMDVQLSPKDKGDWNRAVQFIQLIAAKAEEHGLKPTDRGRIMGGVVGYMRRLRGYYALKGIIADMQAQEKAGKFNRFAISAFFKSGDEGEPAQLSAAINAINDKDKTESGGEVILTDIPEAIHDKSELFAILQGLNPEWGETPVPEIPSPIEMLYKAFGEDNVSVIHGEIKPKDRTRMVKEFQEGKRKIIWFNQAGATGVNMHDTIGKPIRFYHQDYPYAAKEAKQAEGRVNRTGQTTKPTFVYPYLDTSVDTKFVGTLLARYESMGALSRGDAGKLGGDSLGNFDFTGKEAEIAAYRIVPLLDPEDRAQMFGAWTRDLFENPETANDESLIRSVYSGDSVDVKKFLNNLMLLQFDDGNRVFNQFLDVVETVRTEMEAEGGVKDKFETFKGVQKDVAEGKNGLKLRKIQTHLTEKQNKALNYKLNKADEDVQKYENELLAVNERVLSDLEGKAEDILRKQNEEKEKLDALEKKSSDLRKAYLNGYDKNDWEAFQAMEAKASKLRDEIRRREQRFDEAQTKINAITNGKKEVTDQIAEIRRAQALLEAARIRKLSAEAEVEKSKEILLVDGQIATNGLLVPIRKAIRKAAESVYQGVVPMQALVVELRGYNLDDGSKVVGAVVPKWAEGEVAKELNARLAFTGNATNLEALKEHIKNGNPVALENGFEIKWQPKLEQFQIVGMTVSKHRGLFNQLREKGIGFEPRSRSFVVQNDEGFQSLLERFPLKSESAEKVSIEDKLNANINRHNRSGSEMGIVPQGLLNRRGQGRGKVYFPSSDPKVEEQIQKSKTAQAPSILDKFREQLKMRFAEATREFRHLPNGKRFAEIRNALLQLKSYKSTSELKTLKNLQGLLAGFTPQEYELFNRIVVTDDLVEELDQGHELAFEYTPEVLLKDAEMYHDALNDYPNVQNALINRKELWDEIKSRYIENMGAIGFDVASRFSRENYFRHIIISKFEENMREKYGLKGTGQSIHTPSGRGFLDSREGSKENFIHDYLNAESEVMAQMTYDGKIAETIKVVDKHYNVKKELQKLVDEKNNATYNDIMGGMKQDILPNDVKETIRDYYKTVLGLDPELFEVVSEMGESEASPYVDYLDDIEKKMRQRKGFSYKNLVGLAEEGLLWAGENGEWGHVVESLASKEQVDKINNDPNYMTNQFFKYLVALMNSNEDGASWAGTFLKYHMKQKQLFKDILGHRLATIKNHIPKGYVEWQPREGSIYFMGTALDEGTAKMIFEKAIDAIEPSQLKTREVLIVGPDRPSFIIPEEVANQMEDMDNGKGYSYLGWPKKLMKTIKPMMLVTPQKFPKYNIRNESGDIDRVLAGNPKGFKYAGRAARELYELMYRKRALKGELKEWIERGGYEQSQTNNEFQNVKHLDLFKHLDDTKNSDPRKIARILRTYLWDKGFKGLTNYREAILRYANYLSYLEQIDKNGGKPSNYGFSDPNYINGLSDNRDKAFNLSNDLMIAYNRTSYMGQELSDSLLPFWRFQEMNARSYFQLIKNTAYDETSAVQAGKNVLRIMGIKGVGFSVRTLGRLGKTAILVSAFAALCALYNQLRWKKEEDLLPDAVQRTVHIITGVSKDKNGKVTVHYFNNLGVLQDALQWLNAGDVSYYVQKMLNHEMTFADVWKDLNQGQRINKFIETPVNKLANDLGPQIDWVYTALSGKSMFPNVFARKDNHNSIADNLLQPIGLNNEFDAIYKHLWKGQATKPIKLRDYFDYSADEGQSAYYDTKTLAQAYSTNVLKKGTGTGTQNAKSDALYQMKLALQYNDQHAFELALLGYVKAGGNDAGMQKSIESMAPTGNMTPTQIDAFKKTLKGADLEKFNLAEKFYNDVLRGDPKEYAQADKSVGEKILPVDVFTLSQSSKSGRQSIDSFKSTKSKADTLFKGYNTLMNNKKKPATPPNQKQLDLIAYRPQMSAIQSFVSDIKKGADYAVSHTSDPAKKHEIKQTQNYFDTYAYGYLQTNGYANGGEPKPPSNIDSTKVDDLKSLLDNKISQSIKMDNNRSDGSAAVVKWLKQYVK